MPIELDESDGPTIEVSNTQTNEIKDTDKKLSTATNDDIEMTEDSHTNTKNSKLNWVQQRAAKKAAREKKLQSKIRNDIDLSYITKEEEVGVTSQGKDGAVEMTASIEPAFEMTARKSGLTHLENVKLGNSFDTNDAAAAAATAASGSNGGKKKEETVEDSESKVIADVKVNTVDTITNSNTNKIVTPKKSKRVTAGTQTDDIKEVKEEDDCDREQKVLTTKEGDTEKGTDENTDAATGTATAVATGTSTSSSRPRSRPNSPIKGKPASLMGSIMKTLGVSSKNEDNNEEGATAAATNTTTTSPSSPPIRNLVAATFTATSTRVLQSDTDKGDYRNEIEMKASLDEDAVELAPDADPSSLYSFKHLDGVNIHTNTNASIDRYEGVQEFVPSPTVINQKKTKKKKLGRIMKSLGGGKKGGASAETTTTTTATSTSADPKSSSTTRNLVAATFTSTGARVLQPDQHNEIEMKASLDENAVELAPDADPSSPLAFKHLDGVDVDDGHKYVSSPLVVNEKKKKKNQPITPVIVRVASSGNEVNVGLDEGVIRDLDLTPASFQSIVQSNKKYGSGSPYDISPIHLGDFTKGHEGSSPRPAYIALFQQYLNNTTSKSDGSDSDADVDVEAGTVGGSNDDFNIEGRQYIQTLLNTLQQDEENLRIRNEISKETPGVPLAITPEEEGRLHHHLDIAAVAVTTVLLRSNPEGGLVTDASVEDADLDPELTQRKEVFGSNALTEKEMTSFLVLCWEALHDFVLIMLIIMGVVSIAVETTIGREEGEKCGGCWLEGFAILTSVCIVMLVTAGIDYMKQFAFKRLSKSLEARNTKSVLRNGEPVVVTDAEIVVGDILSVNSHSLASIPADCILLGPTMDLQMNESSLTGESIPVKKQAGDIILSGTNAVQGSGKMVVVAVGIHSVSGRIKARVYESGDAEDDDDLEGDDETPLYQKLDKIAKQIGIAGTIAAIFAFVVSASIGLGYHKENWKAIIEYFIVAVTVLAVAVPEGLPLAVVLALAFSSNKMMGENNMVKSLYACETMGCATTICTDKTGTLTANKMTARAIYINGENYICTDPKMTLADHVKGSIAGFSKSIKNLVCNTVAICTMNETFLTIDLRGRVTGSSGNPTEVALLTFVQELGEDYRSIRNETRGRSDVGAVGQFLHEGKLLNFSSARKMMSWAVPSENGGYRLYCKGASEVILARCKTEANEEYPGGKAKLTKESSGTLVATAEQYARRGMRCLGLAYKDLPPGADFEATTSSVKNSDGTDAFLVETDLVFCALVGIEDPLRPEVPEAIERCYEAGIDVRLVTGDSPNTAVSIAFQAGILKEFHFNGNSAEMVAENLKPNVLMEGKVFRRTVYKTLKNGKKEFDQEAFDKIWPYLRVLARSSPDDKLTLAHGLNQSTLFEDEELCQRLLKEDNITIFPDRQVVSMTGDGTNDAPALKRADIGFAMGIAGTQIAKDAADIILIDDNFASIVTAAKWGRNVYASIQKFLQFQLTVNIAAVTVALVGAVVYQKSPLAAIQLLWVNLLMDSLASLALASEPPTAELLKRPPVNRSQHMISTQMWANMLGQAFFQILVTFLLLFQGPGWFEIPAGHLEEKRGINSVHYTIIFNTFVWMQLFNEINSRNLNGEVNVFKGLERNPLFIGILLVTSVLQVIMVEVGGKAMHVADGGLEGKYWVMSIGIGALSLPVQQLINFTFRLVKKKYDEKYQSVVAEEH